MHNLFILVAVFCCFTACTDVTYGDVDELGVNLLEEGGPDVFTAVEINFIVRGNLRRDVLIVYENIYDELTPDLQDNITGVRIFTPLRTIDLSLERDRIYEQNFEVGAQLCYVFTFTGTVVAGGSSRETEICFTVE